MMASIAEQRRFLANIQTVSLKKLLDIKQALLEINELTETDKEFLRRIEIELNSRN